MVYDPSLSATANPPLGGLHRPPSIVSSTWHAYQPITFYPVGDKLYVFANTTLY